MTDDCERLMVARQKIKNVNIMQESLANANRLKIVYVVTDKWYRLSSHGISLEVIPNTVAGIRFD